MRGGAEAGREGGAERAGGAAGGARDPGRAEGQFCRFSGTTSPPLLPQPWVGFPRCRRGRVIEQRRGRQTRAPRPWGGACPGVQVK